MTLNPWRPANPAITSGTRGGRTPEIYLEVVRQFDVEHAGRYQPVDGKTWCAHFVWDVTRAMGAEIPHWWGPKELNANRMFDWLEDYGPRYGWQCCGPAEAVENANQGRPTVVAWLNRKEGPGHIAVVLPGPAAGSPLIAQAGKENFVSRDVREGFGVRPLTYFKHP